MNMQNRECSLLDTIATSMRTLLFKRCLLAFVTMLACTTSSGCVAILSPISGVPAHRLPDQFHAKPKNNLVPVDVSRLRQQAPEQYLVDTGDILGIFIEGVLGEADQPPPFTIPDQAGLPPALGTPIPVREDGTISLPYVPYLKVRGLTITQIEELVRRAYTVDQRILAEGKDRIIVTIMRPREYRIIVLREDGAIGSGTSGGGERQTNFGIRGSVVSLAAYENDLMHALAETGGLPGMNAKNEVQILRSTIADTRRRDAFIQQFYSTPPHDPCLCYPPLPDDPAALRIPLRLPPGQVPKFRQEDIILGDGDIVYIESRDREVYYTGGLLGGGVHPLPRDYDLDVIQALAKAGKGVGEVQGGGSGGIGGLRASVPPGQVYILRKTPCGDQLTIAVDLTRAVRDPKARPLIQAEDVLVLRHKPQEEILNFGIATFFTYGIRDLFRGGR